MTTVTVIIKLVNEINGDDISFNDTNKPELEDVIRDYFEHNIEVDSIHITFED